MEDIEKTKEQLIEEVDLLRSRIAEFETLESERKKAEEELKNSAERLKILFESAPRMVFI